MVWVGGVRQTERDEWREGRAIERDGERDGGVSEGMSETEREGGVSVLLQRVVEEADSEEQRWS